MTTVSVVISTYSKQKVNEVMDCLSSIQKQVLAPSEIILVLDPDQELINFYKEKIPMNVKIAVSKNFGLSEARNEGIRNSSGEIVAFIDDDAIADKNWLEQIVKNYTDLSVIGVGGLIKPFWDSARPRWFPEELDWIIGCSYKGLPEKKSSVRNPIGCNMSFRHSVFEKIGYFSSDLGRYGRKLLDGEEAEFSLRALNIIPYSQIIYDPFSIVYHRVGANRLTVRYVGVRAFYQGVSKGILANVKANSQPLSLEKDYFKFLIQKAFFRRLKGIYTYRNMAQLVVLSFSLFTVFVGYLFGLSKKNQKKTSEKNMNKSYIH